MSEEKEGLGLPEDEWVPEDDRVIGVALKWSLAILVVGAVLVAGWLLFTREKPLEELVVERGPIEAPAKLEKAEAAMPRVRFTDIAAESGIDFVHFNGAAGEKLLPESMGSGVAFFDLEGDGDQDLLFVNGTHWEGVAPGAAAPTQALYRNDGTGTFQNITAGSGLDVSLQGMGVTIGDTDGDGDPDVFITAVGENRYFRNDGGRFTDATVEAGLAGGANTWSSSAGFFDADGDGDLDLFVCNYVQWSRELDLQLNFTLNGSDRAYGPPHLYQGTHSSLYRNDGAGVFTDVSEESGIQVTNPATGLAMGKALAVTFVDIGDDGLMDIVVANDTVQNFLFRNQGGGKFEDVGALSGLGFDEMGAATGAMGTDAADFLNDGHLGVGIGNFANESSSFYVQQRNPWQFADVSGAEGIGSPSRTRLSFGVFFFDHDLDGRLDFLQANGHLEETINEVQPSQQYRQPAQLFWNRGAEASSTFAEVPSERLGELGRPIVGRGAAFADVDADGDLDVVLTQVAGAPLLLRNEQALGHHWLRLRLEDPAPARTVNGAWAEVEAGGERQRRSVMPARSYLSQVEEVLTFGLGKATSVDSLKVHWPDGAEQVVPVGAIDTLVVVRRDPAARPAGAGS